MRSQKADSNSGTWLLYLFCSQTNRPRAILQIRWSLQLCFGWGAASRKAGAVLCSTWCSLGTPHNAWATCSQEGLAPLSISPFYFLLFLILLNNFLALFGECWSDICRSSFSLDCPDTGWPISWSRSASCLLFTVLLDKEKNLHTGKDALISSWHAHLRRCFSAVPYDSSFLRTCTTLVLESRAQSSFEKEKAAHANRLGKLVLVSCHTVEILVIYWLVELWQLHPLFYSAVTGKEHHQHMSPFTILLLPEYGIWTHNEQISILI